MMMMTVQPLVVQCAELFDTQVAVIITSEDFRRFFVEKFAKARDSVGGQRR
jgi:hypothetical protein